MFHQKNNFFLLFLLVFCFFFLIPNVVDAHIGGGPPFLKINGKYANTNPYFQQEITTLNIPQDVSPESYLVNKSINLAVDVAQLTKQTMIPPDMVKNLTFRWSVGTGENFQDQDKSYRYGSDVSYIFHKPQSYLIIIEAKSPIDDDFIIIDTVQLNILPIATYTLPRMTVFIGLAGDSSNHPAFFVSQAKVDSTTEVKNYLWDFMEGKLSNGFSREQSFDVATPYNTRMIYHRVVDSKGFISDVGFAAENYQGKVQFVPFGTMKNAPILIGTYQQAQQLTRSTSSLPLTAIVWGSLMLVGIIVIVIFSFVIVIQQKRRTKPKR